MDHSAQQIINQASSTLSSSGIAAAQNIFKSAILDWVDDVTMGDTMEVEGANEEVAELWLGYALLNREAKLVSLMLFTIYCTVCIDIWFGLYCF